LSEPKHSAVGKLDKLYEFEREPVSADKLEPGRHFAGLFAGEHVAGTEFVIGALFVVWGVTAFDIFVGLLLGNALAVLTWTFICAPIAVRTRLTLYWYLRKIAGPVTTTIYNILNAFLFCILAGSMITVSASAVRIPFGIPAQTNWYPEDARFVLVVLLVGALVVVLAILGFKKLAQFASVCSPWLFLMFIVGAIAVLPGLAAQTPGVGGLGGFNDFWAIANKVVWTGETPDGRAPISFWHVAAFAWICNLAMHGGLSDMALLRYARSYRYGLYSAFGMYLGHYLAWICAGIMGAATALILKASIVDIDAGGVAMEALGVVGIVAVVIAGWTTSNPTLYRAGLALQAVTPGWPRWLVTLLAGVATTVIACFPFVFTKLLGFVGYYGLLLMPVGAVVFTEHWIFPKLGLTQYWASRRNLAVNWPVLLSWGIGIGVALILEKTGVLHLFFLFLPVWFLTTVLYILFASMAGARESLPAGSVMPTPQEPSSPAETDMPSPPNADPNAEERNQLLLRITGAVAIVSLLSILGASIWVFTAENDLYAQRFLSFKWFIIWPTLVYFISGTMWLAEKDKYKES